MDKIMQMYKKDVTERGSMDKEYKEMKDKYDEYRKQILDKDKYIVELGKSNEKQHKVVDEVKGNLERTFTTKIKRRSLNYKFFRTSSTRKN